LRKKNDPRCKSVQTALIVHRQAINVWLINFFLLSSYFLEKLCGYVCLIKNKCFKNNCNTNLALSMMGCRWLYREQTTDSGTPWYYKIGWWSWLAKLLLCHRTLLSPTSILCKYKIVIISSGIWLSKCKLVIISLEVCLYMC
jgi:hypothetical protein